MRLSVIAPGILNVQTLGIEELVLKKANKRPRYILRNLIVIDEGPMSPFPGEHVLKSRPSTQLFASAVDPYAPFLFLFHSLSLFFLFLPSFSPVLSFSLPRIQCEVVEYRRFNECVVFLNDLAQIPADLSGKGRVGIETG